MTTLRAVVTDRTADHPQLGGKDTANSVEVTSVTASNVSDEPNSSHSNPVRAVIAERNAADHGAADSASGRCGTTDPRMNVAGSPLVLHPGLVRDVDLGDPLVDETADGLTLGHHLAVRGEGCRGRRSPPALMRADLLGSPTPRLGIDAFDPHDPLVALLPDRRMPALLPGYEGLLACIVHTWGDNVRGPHLVGGALGTDQTW